jgi:hypothetical protein
MGARPSRTDTSRPKLEASSASTAPSKEGGTPDQYRAALARAITLGWLRLHESGTYVKFTPAGAELFA